MITKRSTLTRLRAANEAGRHATSAMLEHGRQRPDDLEYSDLDRRQNVEAAVAWSSTYARLAREAELDVHRWAEGLGAVISTVDNRITVEWRDR